MALIKDVLGQIFRKAAQGSPPPAGPSLDDKLQAAIEHHQSGRLQEAEKLYKEIIRADPEHADAIHLLGVIAHQGGHQQIAVDLISEAIDIDASNPLYYSNLGEAHLALWEIPEAVECYQSALKLSPQFAQAHSNLGRALMLQGKADEAEAALKRALSIEPGLPAAHFALGDLYASRGDLHAAEGALKACIELDPGQSEAGTLLALVREALGQHDQAAEILLSRLRKSRSPERKIPVEYASFYSTSAGKLAHDAQQLDYLVSRGILPASFHSIADECRQLAARAPHRSQTHAFDISQSASPGFLDSYNRLHHHRPTPEIAQGALNKQLDFPAIEAAFLDKGRRYTYFDGLLSEEALAELQSFCLESTIWYTVEHEDEVGSVVADGFSCPLLFQISHEIRRHLPNILGAKVLRNAWSYRYYGKAPGVRAHMDNGEVSVNFWITPDSANVDADSGGLIIWNKRGPPEYARNTKQQADAIMQRLLAQPDSQEEHIPYRCNRAVIFDALTIHGTDDFDFKPGYENRRTNITLLYGPPR